MGKTRLVRRAGYSMLEVVIALAILSLVALLVVTRASVGLDQISTHTAFQDFQTGLARLRGEAVAGERDLAVTPSSLVLPAGWSFVTPEPMTVDEHGACTAPTVELWRGGKVRAHLVAADRACRYLRAS